MIRISTSKVFVLAALVAATLQGCKKESKNQVEKPVVTDTVKHVVPVYDDPAVAATQGFFLDDWKPKTISFSSFTEAAKPTTDTKDTVYVDMNYVVTKVSPYVYGNNINPYMTQVVTEANLLNNITNLNPHIIRAPGGSIADAYFWNAPEAKPPVDAPDTLLDASGNVTKEHPYWYGKNTAPWTLSVDNYYKVLQITKSTGIITVNYGYARYGRGDHPAQTAAHLAADWVRYDKGKTKFWEVGNENYGVWEAGYHIDTKKNKDGQPANLTGALYGKHFKIFADSMRKAAAELGVKIKIGAVLTANADLGGVVIPNWNADVIATSGGSPDFYVVHDYYTPYMENSKPGTILASARDVTRSIMGYLSVSAVSAQKPVALTEWNIEAVGSNQNVSNIAGLHAAMVLGEVIRYKMGEASRFNLANSWQNGDDQGMFSAGDEVGISKWSARPSFYYMYYFQQFFGDRMMSSIDAGSQDIVSYASSFSSGHAGVVLVNKGQSDRTVTVNFQNFTPGKRYYYYTLNGGTETYPFSRKVYVNNNGPVGVAGGPPNYLSINPNSAVTAGGIKVAVPAYGAVFLVAEGK